MEYPAKIKYIKRDKVFEVNFYDLKGCCTFGETFEDALKYAKEALTGWLAVSFDKNKSIPQPSKRSGKNDYYISPDLNVAFAIKLREERNRKNLSQKQVADKLGISHQAYQKFENPNKANATIKTIMKLEKVLEKKFIKI